MKELNAQEKVQKRIKEEKQIMRHCIKELLSHGFKLSVFDGEETVISKSSDRKKIFESMYSTDEDVLKVWKDGIKIGMVYFVYGNESHEVINDYSTKLEEYLTSTTAYAEKFDR